MPPATPAFRLPSCPHPPRPPSRREGGDQGYFMQGASPLASPGLDRLRHLQTLPLWCLRGACPCLAGSAGVDGTRRAACLLYRLSPQPLDCLLAPIPPDPLPLRGRGRPRLFHARGFAPCIPGTEPMVRRKNGRKRFPARVPPGLRSRGSGGGSPRRNKVKVSPFPAGEGGWGDRGQESKLKAGAADNPNRRTPAGQRQRPPKPTRKKASPLESRNGGGQPVPRPVQPRGCKGRSPLHKKTKNLPFPGGEGGRGMGA